MNTPSPVILTIEDNPITRKMIRVALAREGYDVREAADAEAGLAALDRGTPDLVLLDLGLPDMDGFELAPRLRQRLGSRVPIVACSGFASALDAGGLADLGFDEFLVKPVKPSRIVATVRRHLTAREAVKDDGATVRRVLVVDDDAAQAKLLRILLRERGFEVSTAANGREGLAQAIASRPDAIVTDAVMPELDGIGLTVAVRQHPGLAGVPVVLYSSTLLDDGLETLARASGATAFARRSPDFEDVIDALLGSLASDTAAPVPAPSVTLDRERAAQMTLALRREMARTAKLEEQLATQTATLSVVTSTAEMLAAAEDPTAATRAILLHCLDAAGVPMGALYRVHPNGRRSLLSQMGYLASVQESVSAVFGHPSLVTRVASAGRPLVLPSAEPGIDSEDFLLRAAGTSAMLIPLSAGDECLGVMLMVSESKSFGDEHWRAFAEAISVQFGQTLRLVLRQREAEQLARVARALAESRDPAVVAERVVESALALLDLTFAMVWRKHHDGSLVRLAFRQTGSSVLPPDEVLPPGFGVAGRAVVEGRTLCLDDVLTATDVRLTPTVREAFRRADGAAVVAVPLRVKRRIIGALSVGDERGRRFTPADVALLEQLADPAAIAFENARLFENAERRRREAESLADLGQQLSSELDTAAAARRVAEAVLALLDVSVAGLYQVDRASGDLVMLHLATAGGEPHQWLRVLPRGHGLAGLAVTGGEPVQSPDTLADARVVYPSDPSDSIRQSPCRAGLSVPLRIKDRVIGILSVGAGTGRVFDADEIRLAQAFAHQVAIALENARLFAEAEEGRRVAETLADLGRELSAELNADKAAERVTAGILTLLGARVAALYRLDPASADIEIIKISTSDGRPSDWARVLPRGCGLSGLAVREGQAVWSADVLTDPRVVYPPGLLDGAENRACLAAPLRIGDRVIGALAVADRTGRIFDEKAARLAQAFADHAAIALENGRLHGAAVARGEELAALLRATGTVMEGLDLDATLRRIAGEASVIAGTPHVKIVLVDPAQHVLRSTALLGAAVSSGTDVPIGQGYSGRVVASGTPLFVANVQDDPDNLLCDHARAAGLVTYLGLPIKRGAEVLGVLVFNTTSPYAYADAEIEYLSSFAAQAAVAIDNARLYADAERRRRAAEVMAELAASINASLDVDVTLERIADAARELCQADLSRIALREPRSGLTVFRLWPGGRFTGYEGFQVRPGLGMSGAAMLTRRAIRSADLPHDPRFADHDAVVVQAEGVVAQVVAPIVFDGEAEGLIYVSNRSARPFTGEDERVLARLADHAAIAIKNARLFAREQAARREAERLGEHHRGIVEGSIEGIMVHRNDTILFANDAAARLHGYERAGEIVGMSLLGFIAADDRPAVAARIERRQRGEAVGNRFEAQALRRDGTRVPTECLVSVIPWDGAPAIFVTVADVSERKAAAEALAQSEEQVRQLQKMEAVGRLAGGVAHDFNNLLTVILARAELLMNRVDSTHPSHKNLKLIQETGKRAAELTKRLLAFSRKQVLQPKVLELNTVIGGLESILRRLIGEDIEFRTELAPDRGRVKADPTQLEQVVMNLVVNARDAMPQGGRLFVKTRNVDVDEAMARLQKGIGPGAYVALEVSDTGCGMDAATIARLFEPFFTTKGPERGTGLGLSTVFGVVKQSGGHIRVYSEPGMGSVFKVYLPRVEDTAQVAAAEPDTARPRGAGTILLVEDEDTVRDVAHEMLDDAGYTVLVARNGSEALGLACDRRPDLLVTDVVMPGMSGPELARQMAVLHPGLKVLFVSGYTDEMIGHHGVLERGQELLEKPYTVAGLLARVRDVLETKGDDR